MVDVRSAVGAAQQYFNSVQDMIGFGTEDLRLEEAELSEYKKHWFITLGLIRPVDKTSNYLGDLIATRN
jgi:hypothetical protein